MSLNELVHPIKPLDIIVGNLTVTEDFDIKGTIEIEGDLVVEGNTYLLSVDVTGPTKLSDPVTLYNGTPNSAIYLSSDTPPVLSYSTAMTDGQVLIGNTGEEPAVSTITAGDNIQINNGPSSILINTISTPSFNDISLYSTANQITLGAESGFKNIISSPTPGQTTVIGIPDSGNSNSLFILNKTTPGVQNITTQLVVGADSPLTNSLVNSEDFLNIGNYISYSTSNQFKVSSNALHPTIISVPTMTQNTTLTVPDPLITAADFLLSEGDQKINGEKKFYDTLGFTRLDNAPSGGSNTLITSCPNIAANSNKATVIGGVGNTAESRTNCVVVGNNVATSINNTSNSVLIGESIVVDEASSNNIVIGKDITVAGNNKIVIGNSSTVSMTCDSEASLGLSTKRYASAHLAGNVNIYNNRTIAFYDVAGTNSLTIDHSPIIAVNTLSIPIAPGDGYFGISNRGSVSQSTSPTTEVKYDGYSCLIETQPFDTAALSYTAFQFTNAVLTDSLVVQLTISNYSGSTGLPSVRAFGRSGGYLFIAIQNSHPVNIFNGSFQISVNLS